MKREGEKKDGSNLMALKKHNWSRKIARSRHLIILDLHKCSLLRNEREKGRGRKGNDLRKLYSFLSRKVKKAKGERAGGGGDKDR